MSDEITQADIDAMEAIYRRINENFAAFVGLGDEIERFYALAAKLAALLPPEKPQFDGEDGG